MPQSRSVMAVPFLSPRELAEMEPLEPIRTESARNTGDEQLIVAAPPATQIEDTLKNASVHSDARLQSEACRATLAQHNGGAQ